MSNVLLAYPNTIDSAALTGGGWVTTMPLTNVQDIVIKNAARSKSAAIGATTFNFKYTAASLVAFAALVDHNISTAGTVRLRGYTFAQYGYDWDFRNGQMPAGFMFQRLGTNATYVDVNGILQTAAANVPRYDKDDQSPSGTSLLLEPANNNVVLWNCDFSGPTPWVKVNCTAAKTATGPDGIANSASTITATSGSATIRQSPTIAASSFTSCWVRRRTGVGTIGFVSGAGTTNITAQLTSAWQRFYLPISAVANAACGFDIATSGDAIDVAYFQTELVGHTTPVLTTTASAARNADTLSLTGAAFTAVFNATTGTIACDFALPRLPSATAATPNIGPYSLGAGTNQNYLGVNITSAGVATYTVISGNVSQVSNALGTLAANTSYYVASTYALNDFGSSINGAAAVQDSAGALPVGSVRLQVGASLGATGTAEPIRIRRIQYLPGVRIANADLATFATESWNANNHTYDSGALPALPAAYVAATTPAQRASLTQSTPLLLATPQTLQYWRVDISDTGNTAGYVQVGRVMVADTAFQPDMNMEQGANIQWIDRAEISEADSGAEYFYDRPKYRSFKFNTERLTEDEAMAKVMEMHRTLGTTGEVYVMYDPDDTTYLPNRSFLARLRQLSALATPYWKAWSTAFELKERL